MEIRSIALLCLAASAASIASTPSSAQLPSNATVYASGLQAPRGLRFGPDGYLYVAEAGTGGSNSTGTACTQVPAPVGPIPVETTREFQRSVPRGRERPLRLAFLRRRMQWAT
jgi:hypothetical protein